jgi:phosphoribosylanthranilate isomerase
MSIVVKVCGLSTPESVDVAVQAGAQFIGFNFFPPSPRAIQPSAARDLAQRVPNSVRKVAVVVDPTNDTLGTIVEALGADIVQLHGNEPPERVAEVRDRFGCCVIKAVAISRPDDVARALRFGEVADMLLFDAKAQSGDTLPGGNARQFDWSLLSDVAVAQPWFLAGGLNAENLAEAIAISGARSADVSSGVESERGAKDHQKIVAFLAAAEGL